MIRAINEYPATIGLLLSAAMFALSGEAYIAVFNTAVGLALGIFTDVSKIRKIAEYRNNPECDHCGERHQ